MYIKKLLLQRETIFKQCRTIGSVALFFVFCLPIQVMAQNVTQSTAQSQTEPAKRYYPWSPDLSQVPKMVLFITPEVEVVKARCESATANIDFKKGQSKIEPKFGRNPAELDKIDTLVKSVIGNDLIDFKRVQITGYSSIEGSYDYNKTLAQRRAEGFAQYVQKSYKVEPTQTWINFVAEDWDGLVKLVQAGTMQYKDEVLAIISSVSIKDGREKRLMNLHGGAPYRYMLTELFPLLRRISIEVDYVVRPVPMEQIRETFENRPSLLSLDEMYRIAPKYSDNPTEYQKLYETVARHYPNDVVANNNAAAAALLNKDVVTARYFLDKIATDPRSSINRATLLYIGGEREASRDEFHRGWDAGFGTRLSDKLFELTPIPAEPVVEPTPEPAPVVEVAKVFVPRFAIKTNLLLLAGVQSDFEYYGVTPNLALEYYFAKRWSVNVDGAWADFKTADTDTKERYAFSSVGVEARHWFGKSNAFKGLYAGLYGAYSQFNTMDPDKRDGLGHSGDLYGGGLSVGYVLPITQRLILEVGLRGGYRYADYQTYFHHDQPAPSHFEWSEDLTKSGFAIQSFNFSIGYRFGKTK